MNKLTLLSLLFYAFSGLLIYLMEPTDFKGKKAMEDAVMIYIPLVVLYTFTQKGFWFFQFKAANKNIYKSLNIGLFILGIGILSTIYYRLIALF